MKNQLPEKAKKLMKLEYEKGDVLFEIIKDLSLEIEELKTKFNRLEEKLKNI
jgi:FtsZ-binding cell division protein ZapB